MHKVIRPKKKRGTNFTFHKNIKSPIINCHQVRKKKGNQRMSEEIMQDPPPNPHPEEEPQDDDPEEEAESSEGSGKAPPR